MAKTPKERTRDWAKPKTPDACCTPKNLGDLERLPGSDLKFRRCTVCNRRYFEKPASNGQLTK